MGNAERDNYQKRGKVMLTSTIAAISTPVGKGGIGIIRISGDEAMAVASRVFKPRNKRDLSKMEGYTACLGTAHNLDGEVLDQAILLCFRAPRSYTGEDVVELQCHGGEAVTEAVILLPPMLMPPDGQLDTHVPPFTLIVLPPSPQS